MNKTNIRQKIEEIIWKHNRWSNGATKNALNMLDVVDQLENLIKEERKEAYKSASENQLRCLSTCQTCVEARRYFNK